MPELSEPFQSGRLRSVARRRNSSIRIGWRGAQIDPANTLSRAPAKSSRFPAREP
jgi:hypothetical protein